MAIDGSECRPCVEGGGWSRFPLKIKAQVRDAPCLSLAQETCIRTQQHIGPQLGERLPFGRPAFGFGLVFAMIPADINAASAFGIGTNQAHKVTLSGSGHGWRRAYPTTRAASPGGLAASIAAACSSVSSNRSGGAFGNWSGVAIGQNCVSNVSNRYRPELAEPYNSAYYPALGVSLSG